MELAIIASMSVPVVGAVLSSPGLREVRQIASANLRRTLVVSQVLAGLAAIAFLAAVLLGVLVADAHTEVIFIGLGAGTLGVVSLLVGRRTAGAQRFANDVAAVRDDASARFALITNLVDGIHDRATQDQVRADAAKLLIRSLAGERAEDPGPMPNLPVPLEKSES
ncbi:hypothetical protein [Nocardia sp. NPDC050406]|uniref:hypothetical protein n=1 Tax=Nocardia sp. NPDC050406 TaxID=3364318 RepID=UPI0037A70942